MTDNQVPAQAQPEPRYESEPIRTSPEVDQVFAALVGAQSEVTEIPKNGVNPHFGSKYSTLEDTIEVCRPVLAKHNLAVLSGPTSTPGSFGSVVRLIHKSGQWVQLQANVKATKGIQELGAVQTYLRRFCLGGILNTAGESDDDGEGAEGRGSKRPRPAKAKADWTQDFANRINQPPPAPSKAPPAKPEPKIIEVKNDGTSWIKCKVSKDFAGWATVCKNKDHSDHAEATYGVASNCTICRGILRWILTTDVAGAEGSELRKRATKIVSFIDDERKEVQILKSKMKEAMAVHGIRRPQWKEAINLASAGRASSFPDLSKWSMKDADELLVIFEKSGADLAKELEGAQQSDPA